jgi:hypothetical protein
MIELTMEQHRALEGGETLAHDPQTNARYVLVAEEMYRRLQDLLATGPLTPDEREAILRGVWKRAGWDDPRMEAYDSLSDNP